MDPQQVTQNIITEFQLTDLTSDEQQQAVEQIMTELFLRTMDKAIGSLPEDQRDQFSDMFTDDTEPNELMQKIAQKVPNLQQFSQQAMAELKSDYFKAMAEGIAEEGGQAPASEDPQTPMM